MSATTALARGRRAHEKLMVDRCVIHSIAKSGTINEATGKYDDIKTQTYPALPLADGPCQLTFADTVIRDVEAGGQLLIEGEAELALPVDTSTGVEEGHVVTMTFSLNDPDLAGVELSVEGPHHQTYATARRLRVKETK